MKNYSLLDRAEKDLFTAKLIFNHWDGDELTYDTAAYHVQQSIEKTMKFVLSQHKVKFRKQHDAIFLKEHFEDAGIPLPPWFVPNMDTLDSYVTETRYGSDLVSARSKILELLNYAEEYILEVRQEIEKRQLEQQKPLEKSSVFIKPDREEKPHA